MPGEDSRLTLRRRLVPALVVAAVVLALVLVMRQVTGAAGDKPSHRADRRVSVTVAPATTEDLAVWKEGVGTIQPLEVVDVKSRVDGQIVRIDFTEGREVGKGALLAQLDPRPYQALLAQAVAAKARDAAQLANARLGLQRANSLVGRGFVTAQSVDALKAQVATFEATLAGDQAQIDTARLNLGFTGIRAPIAGRTGIRQVNTGASVRSNDTGGIVTLTQMAPIAAIFSLPQDDLAAIAAARGATAVTAYSQDGATRLAQGTLSAVDNQIDPANGRVRLKAVFANADRTLWPGELVTVRLLSRIERSATVVPAAAIQMSQAGPFVYVVGKGAVVARRPVATGTGVDGKVAVTRGVRAGETVIVAGQSRVAEGDAVDARRAGRGG